MNAAWNDQSDVLVGRFGVGCDFVAANAHFCAQPFVALVCSSACGGNVPSFEAAAPTATLDRVCSPTTTGPTRGQTAPSTKGLNNPPILSPPDGGHLRLPVLSSLQPPPWGAQIYDSLC